MIKYKVRMLDLSDYGQDARRPLHHKHSFELHIVIMHQKKSSPFNNILLLIAVVPAAAWFSYKNRNYQVDDALIYLRYIRNLFDGFGLTYNAGERFNGLTSPLYSYLLIAVNSITHSLQYTTIFLSFVFFCAAAIYGAALVSDQRIEQALCGLFIVAFNYFYTTFGMETTLFLFLTALALHFYRNNSLFWTGLTIGLVILTRAEGIFLGVVIFLHHTITYRRIPPIKYLIAPAFLILANLVFNYFYYGSPLPATGNAKIGQGRSGLWGDGYPFLNVSYMKDWFFGKNYYLPFFIFPTAIIGLIACRRWFTTYLITMYMMLLSAFYIFLLIPNYHWYYGPYFYFLLLFSAVGVYQTISFLASLSSRYWICWLVTVPATAVVIAFVGYNLKLADIARGPSIPYRNIGNWMDNNTEKNATIAMVEIGTVGWYTHRYIIDILGLVNPYNADFIARKDVHSWLTRYYPDYIVVHDPPWPMEQSITCLRQSGAYERVPDFKLAGGDLFRKSSGAQAAELALACGNAQNPGNLNINNSVLDKMNVAILRFSGFADMLSPANAEGLVNLLGHYSIDKYFNPYLQFDYRNNLTTVSVAAQPFAEMKANIGQPVDIKSEGPVWASFDIRPTLLGKLLAHHVNPSLDLDLTLDNGMTVRYPLEETVANAGFILSPYLSSTHDIISFAADLRILPKVKTLRIQSKLPLLWKNDFSVQLKNIDLKPQAEARALILSEPLSAPPAALLNPKNEPVPSCFIDRVDNQPFPVNGTITIKDGFLRLEGWSAPDPSISVPSVQTYFAIQDSAKIQYFLANSTERPDVVSATKRTELKSAGFDTLLELGMNPGTQLLQMYTVANGAAYRCNIKATLN